MSKARTPYPVESLRVSDALRFEDIPRTARGRPNATHRHWYALTQRVIEATRQGLWLPIEIDDGNTDAVRSGISTELRRLGLGTDSRIVRDEHTTRAVMYFHATGLDQT